MLTLNDCGIVSLENFPDLKSLIRLDMVFNNIPGEHLKYLSHLRHIQTLMFGANKIEKVEHLNAFKTMKSLLQIDLLFGLLHIFHKDESFNVRRAATAPFSPMGKNKALCTGNVP